VAKRRRRKVTSIRGVVRQEIRFRPGSLAGPMTTLLLQTGETTSQYVRRVIAADLGVPCPAFDGRLKNLVQFRKGSDDAIQTVDG